MIDSLSRFISACRGRRQPRARFNPLASTPPPIAGETLGLIAGNGSFPLLICKAAARHGCRVVAVCHKEETSPEIESIAQAVTWIKIGELGRLISALKEAGVTKAVMAGGINRIKLFGGVKLDFRGAALLAKLRSTKDDIIMRGIADELGEDGITVIPCTTFMEEHLAPEGVITRSEPSAEELQDIQVGMDAITAMSRQDIGQLVVVREGVVVAVEAVEGTDAAIRRGGELGGKGTVVVKCAKPSQDLRFDVPTIGTKTMRSLIDSKARVLAVEAGRTLVLDHEEVVRMADTANIAIIGCPALDRVARTP